MNYLEKIEFSIRYPRRWQAYEEVVNVVEDILKAERLDIAQSERLATIYQNLKLTSDYFNMWDNHMSQSGYIRFVHVCSELSRFIEDEVGK
jgi:hypothetical protein